MVGDVVVVVVVSGVVCLAVLRTDSRCLARSDIVSYTIRSIVIVNKTSLGRSR